MRGTLRGPYGYTRRSSMLANYFVVVGYRVTASTAHGAFPEVSDVLECDVA